MGLDMYAYKVKADVLDGKAEVDFEVGDEQTTEIMYWRKHHDLHGLMNMIYVSKEGEDPDFNCVNLRLTEEDLDLIESSVKNYDLPETTGFFFGNNPPDDESNQEDLEFVARAREAIADGYAVVYHAWY